MKNYLLLFTILLSISTIQAQNCSNTSVDLPPIADLGKNYWQGFQGGLYPSGSNEMPAAHKLAGMQISENIKPLDTAGNIDLTNGKIVWLSIGMSNTTMETQAFIHITDTFSNKNPKLTLIDDAVSGQDIVLINNPNAG